MFRVAMLSRWHVHASGYARDIASIPGCEIAYVWDEEPARGEAWAKELGVPFVASLDELLAKDDYQGVIVVTPTSMHDEVLVKAAKAGKHIYTEKALSTTVAGCEKIAEAVKAANVKLFMSYPYRVMPVYILAKQLIDEGAFGDISMFRMRNGHDGASRGWLPDYWFDKSLTGGGALMDLGCHPCYLADWMLGAPKKMSASMTYVTGHDTDDAAVCMVEFKNGAVAVLETSLITPYSPGTLEIYGTKGSFRSLGDDVRLRFGDSPGWFKPDRLPKAPASVMEQWVKAVTEGGPADFDVDAGTRLTVLLEAAYKSYESATPVVF